MTSTVLRVKRRLEDNPQDALVLMCKRIKTDTEEISPSLFVFRGTVDNPEVIQVKDITPKSGLKSKHNVNELLEKIRKECKDTSSESRYEVINCRRGLPASEEEASGDIFDLVDLQQKKKDLEEADVKYAYDLYIAAKQDFDISMIDTLISIEDYETNLILDSYRDNGRQTPSSNGPDDDDDSNDENNWRNDYPDSEHSSIKEEDMLRAMENVDLEDDLSSDEGEDKIYDEPNLTDDAERYGAAYAKYKARVLAEGDADEKSLIHCSKAKDMDEESVEGYKEDSDDGFFYGQDDDSAHHLDQDSSDEGGILR